MIGLQQFDASGRVIGNLQPFNHAFCLHAPRMRSVVMVMAMITAAGDFLTCQLGQSAAFALGPTLALAVVRGASRPGSPSSQASASVAHLSSPRYDARLWTALHLPTTSWLRFSSLDGLSNSASFWQIRSLQRCLWRPESWLLSL